MCLGLAVLGAIYLVQLILAVVVITVTVVLAFASWSPFGSIGPVLGPGLVANPVCGLGDLEIALFIFAFALSVTVVIAGVLAAERPQLVLRRYKEYGACDLEN